MEIEKIASAVGSSQSIAGVAQSSGAQDSQIAELQRLADSIRKMENDYRITARVQGVSGSGLQMKLRQYDDILAKVDQQIRQLQQQNRQTDDTKNGFSRPGRLGVSMLQYNTDAAEVAMQNSGLPLSTAVSNTMQAQIAKAVSNAAARKAEQKIESDAQKEQNKSEAAQGGAALLNVLV